MSRRVIGLCLLAYPRSLRRRDGAYLRDLAAELAETNGVAREARSLLLAGLVQRCRQPFTARRAASLVALGAPVAAAFVVVALAVVGSSDTEIEVHSCADTSSAACARIVILAETMERDGWDCESQRTTVAGRQRLDLQCRLGA